MRVVKMDFFSLQLKRLSDRYGRKRELSKIAALLRPHFEEAFYRANYASLTADADPVIHYIEQGWREG